MTNFERMTESPEKLMAYLRKFSCSACPMDWLERECVMSEKSCDELILEWLQEESE